MVFCMNAFTKTKPRHDDGGYSVLVVMGFVLLLMSAILFTGFQIQSDTINGQSLSATSARHDALTAVGVAGLQSLRYAPLIGTGQTLNASPPSYCFGTASSSVTVNSFTATAYCSTTTMTTYPNATTEPSSPPEPSANEGPEYYCTSPAVLDTTTSPPTCVTTTTSSTGVVTTTSAAATPIGYTVRNVTLYACTSGDATSCAANPELTITAMFWDDQTDTATNTTDCSATCGYAETIGTWKW